MFPILIFVLSPNDAIWYFFGLKKVKVAKSKSPIRLKLFDSHKCSLPSEVIIPTSSDGWLSLITCQLVNTL